MINPLPIDFLIHSVTYEEFVGKGRDRNVYKSSISLQNVLIQPVSSLKRSGLSVENSFKSLMFFDCVNSTPNDIQFVKGSKITFNNQVMYINGITPISAFTLHHYELELI